MRWEESHPQLLRKLKGSTRAFPIIEKDPDLNRDHDPDSDMYLSSDHDLHLNPNLGRTPDPDMYFSSDHDLYLNVDLDHKRWAIVRFKVELTWGERNRIRSL